MTLRRTIQETAFALLVIVAVAGCTAMTGESARKNVNDAAITSSVKTHLAGDRVASLTSVDVVTVGGTVYLTGIVPDYTAKQRAEQIARNVDGVRNVVNDLKTRSAADAPK